MQTSEITSLSIYPVKSMRGIAMQSAELGSHGLKHDRQFMVVRSNGSFVTQRDLPRLAAVQTLLAEDGVILSLADHGSVTIPHTAAGGDRIHTKVWKDDCETVDQGEEISRWLSDALESSDILRLVKMAPDFVRPQNQPGKLGQGTTTWFADASPYLVANEASLEALNRELTTRGLSAVPMNRFRPNIVVKGLAAFDEHGLSELSSENYRLKLCHPCERCVVTTIDQATGAKDPDRQPFMTLRDINPLPGNKLVPVFAQNAILESGSGQQISVGQKLTVHFRNLPVATPTGR